MSRLTVRVIDSFDELRALEAEWWQLWRACPAATPFQSPAWLIPWWDVFAPGTLAVHAVYAGCELVGLAPLYVEQEEGLGRLLPLGISLSDYGDMLVQPDGGDVPGALSASLAEGDLAINWVDLPTDAAAHAVPAPTGWRDETGAGEPCPVLPLAGATGTPCDAPSCVPAPRRRKVRMALHRAERRGGIRITTEQDFAPSDFLDALARLHGDRWKSRGEAGVLHDEAVLRFHALALPRLVAAGLADLRLLSIGGELAGAYLGLRDERRSYAYIGGMAPGFARESPGAILLNAALCDAVARGAAEFHFLRGAEPYKYEWGAVDRWNGWRTLSPPSPQADAANDATPGQPPHLTLMHLLMSADNEEAARQRLAEALALSAGEERRRLEAVQGLWARLPDAWDVLTSVLAEARHDAGAPSPTDAVNSWTRIFDQLATHAPEAGVALYTLGDFMLLDSASREVVDALVQRGDLRSGLRVLDLGCGIGRLSGLMAAAGAEVLGVDVSLGMLREAAKRCTGPRTHFARLSGHDLAALADNAFDLVLAVDVFPYLVLAGEAVAGGHIREIARILRPRGRLVLANLSYRGDAPADAQDLRGWLHESGMRLLAEPARPFSQWDGLVFRAERPPS